MSSYGHFGSAALAGLATWLATAPAWAQEGGAPAGALGSRDAFVLSLEHLGGYSNQRIEFEGSDPTTGHQFGLFTPFLGPYGSHARLGLHYFVAPPISVGALLNYSDNDQVGTHVLLGLRVGAAIPMSGSTSLWLRGGIAFSRTTLEQGRDKDTFTALVPGGEVLFAFKPLDHFGFLVGGMFELALNGKHESENEGQPDRERDYDARELGLTLGAFIEF